MALTKCPECGGTVSDKAPRCIHCGFPISNDNKVSQSGSTIISSGRPQSSRDVPKFYVCKFCGSLMPEGMGFCPKCGKSKMPKAELPPEKEKNKNTKWIIITLAAVFLLVGLLFFRWYFSVSNGNERNKLSSNSNNDSHSQPISEQMQNSYEKFNIIDFSELPNSKDHIIGIDKYTIEWAAHNNSNIIIQDFTITVCFYDEAGTIIRSESRTPRYALEPDQSAIIKFYCEKDFASSKVTNYSYLPSSTELLPEGCNGVDINTVSQSCTFFYRY